MAPHPAVSSRKGCQYYDAVLVVRIAAEAASADVVGQGEVEEGQEQQQLQQEEYMHSMGTVLPEGESCQLTRGCVHGRASTCCCRRARHDAICPDECAM
jgi:hypothetical protein